MSAPSAGTPAPPATPAVPHMLGRGMTMSDLIARHARTNGDATAVVFEGATRTYRTLDERVGRLANALRDRGVRQGDRVAVLGMNTLEVLEAFFAATRLGAICVPINFRLTAGEIAYMLADSGAAAAIVHAPLAATHAEAAGQVDEPPVTLVYGTDDAGRAPADAVDYEEALAAASPEFDELPVDEHDPAFIMYTSGTTGKPKGAVLTHFNLVMHAFSNMATMGVANEDRVWMAAAPLFHIAGMSGLIPNLILGGRLVLAPSGRFDPVETLDTFERERVSSVFLVPAQWQAIVSVPDIDRRDLSSLKKISWGASPATTTLLRTIMEKFPHAELSTAFGQTECSPITTLLRGEDSLRKIGSVGKPMLNVEVRVVDDDMNDVPRGEVGEIVYRSPMVMTEYWNKPAETAEVFRGGWFHSGDLVREDEDGYFYVVDRKKDMIISGGENIYCAEVEDVLAGHPKIGEVALIAVTDEKWGETPLAVLAPRDENDPPTGAELDEWCLTRLARYKRPRKMALVPALPRNPSGKVLKTQLRSDRDSGALPIESV